MDQYMWTLKNIELTETGISDVPKQKVLGDYTILILIRGEGTIEVDNKTFCCSNGSLVLFCNPDTIIRYTQIHPRRSLLLYELTVGAYDKTQIEHKEVYEKRSSGLFPNGDWGSGYYSRIRELAEHMELLKRANEAANFFNIQMLFYECLHLLSKDYEKAQSVESQNIIQQATAYIQEHYDEDIQRSQLAEMAGINKEYFSRLFKKETGRSFSEYLRETRIQKAREYLLTSKAGLREIAQRVGYKNEFYLSQKFKQATGVPPSIYIKQPKKIASVSSNYTGCLLALGITPVIAKINPFIEGLFRHRIQADRIRTIDLLTTRCNRLVAEACPDLVICHDTYEQLEELKRSVPTVSISLFKQSWREQLMEVSSIVHAERRAEEWLEQFDEKIGIARKRLERIIGGKETVGIYEIWKDKILVFGESYGRGGHLIYQDLKLSPTSRIRQDVFTGPGYKAISLEELPHYAADHMFITVFHAKEGEAYASQIMNSPTWRRLPAVRNKRVYVNDHGVFYNWDPVSTEVQLERVVRSLMS